MRGGSRGVVQGEVLSHVEMCIVEGRGSLQQGMNFRSGAVRSVILMSVRRGAPYADRLEDEGRVLIYEGHNIPRTAGGPDPRAVDQAGFRPSGLPTQNGLFADAAEQYKAGRGPAERVWVYDKVKQGIWTFNGVFSLDDAWQEPSGERLVYKFRLQMVSSDAGRHVEAPRELAHHRMIPTQVKLDVWRRDRGRCVLCGSDTNLHFDHILPFSKGGSSLVAGNIQVLCARHNLAKSARIL